MFFNKKVDLKNNNKNNNKTQLLGTHGNSYFKGTMQCKKKDYWLWNVKVYLSDQRRDHVAQNVSEVEAQYVWAKQRKASLVRLAKVRG